MLAQLGFLAEQSKQTLFVGMERSLLKMVTISCFVGSDIVSSSMYVNREVALVAIFLNNNLNATRQ